MNPGKDIKDFVWEYVWVSIEGSVEEFSLILFDVELEVRHIINPIRMAVEFKATR